MNISQGKKYGSLMKWILHTKIGPMIGFYLGISGYNRVVPTIIRANGKIEKSFPSFNSRVNVGAGLCAYLLSGTNLASLTSPSYPIYIALSTSSLTPAAGDTTLAGEIVSTGLTRVAGSVGSYTSPAVLDGSASYTITQTFPNSSASTFNVQSSALFDAVTSGNMFVEANLSVAQNLFGGDKLLLAWTVNF